MGHHVVTTTTSSSKQIVIFDCGRGSVITGQDKLISVIS